MTTRAAADASPGLDVGVSDISVVIPHLNQPKFLERCLASLASQRELGEASVEIIVVDNGSQALPRDICESFGVQLLRETTPGPGPARNMGAIAARADLLAFIDADCIADPHWLSAVLAHFADPAAEIAGGDVRIWREQPEAATVLEAYESVYAYRMKEYIERQGFTGTGNLAVRRRVLEDVGPFGGIDIAEDRDWGQRAGAKGYVISYAPDMRVFHPARRSFSELFEKWSRHVGHDRVKAGSGGAAVAKWLARTAMVAASPIYEFWRVARSDRVSGVRERAMAWLAVCRVRAYRTRLMLGVIRLENGEALSREWNRG